MTKTKIAFEKADKSKDFRDIYGHNLDAFSETPDFKWTYNDIKKEVDEGWELYSVKVQDEIIAAVFLKIDKDKLLTKNTALKMSYQGQGLSHKIKEFFENTAKKRKLTSIIHYCRIDDFRAYSLNEGHGYKQRQLGGSRKNQVIEWIKDDIGEKQKLYK